MAQTTLEGIAADLRVAVLEDQVKLTIQSINFTIASLRCFLDDYGFNLPLGGERRIKEEIGALTVRRNYLIDTLS